MYYDDLNDPPPGEDLRDCLKSAYDERRPALLPPRMADLLDALRRCEVREDRDAA